MEIIITDCDHGFINPEREIVEGAGHRLFWRQCRTSEDVVEVAQSADALICQAAPITGEVLRLLPRCKVVGRYGVGLDNVDVKVATGLGIKVVHVPDFCYEEVADHTIGLILALARRVVSLSQVWKKDPASFVAQWPKRLEIVQGVKRLSRQILGIVGLGRIGQNVALRSRTLGFQVMGHDPWVSVEQMGEWGVQGCTLEELLAISDFVTLHIPLTESTRGLIGERELRLMKPISYLVNTSRGGVVVEPALIQALKEGRIAGAALDVTTAEPPPDNHPFLQMDQVILTPHVAFYSDDSIHDVKARTALYVVRALAGEGEYCLANPEVQSR